MVTPRILHSFNSVKVFFLFFFLLTTPLVLSSRRIPHRPSQELGEFEGPKLNSQGEDLPTQGGTA